MKKLLLTAIVGVALAYSGSRLMADDDDGSPGHKKEKGVPPGLAKKGGLPPGQAKKLRGQDASAPDAPAPAPAPASQPGGSTAIAVKPASPQTPKPPVTTSVTPATPASPGTPAPPKPPTDVAKADAGSAASTSAKTAVKVDKDVLERRARLEKQIAELDAMGKRPEVKDRLSVRLYRRMDLPLNTVETQQKAYPEVGMGGIVVANYIARWGKVPADRVLAEHKAGKSWGEIANAHKVSLHDLIDKAGEAKQAARDAEHDAAAAAKKQ